MSDVTYHLVYAPSAAEMASRQFFATTTTGWQAWLIRHGFFVALVVAVAANLVIGFVLYGIASQSAFAFAGFVVGTLAMVSAGLAAVLGFNAMMYPIRRRAFATEPDYDLTLTAAGAQLRWGQSLVQLHWSDVRAVKRWSAMTVLVLGEGRALAVPDSALPAELTARDFVSEISVWRGVAA